MTARWIMVRCVEFKCTNYGGYYSNTGKPKADKKDFHCEEHK